MTIQKRVAWIAQQLLPLYRDIDRATMHAWWIVEGITQHAQTKLLSGNLVLTDEQEQKLHAWIYALLHDHMPLQYLLGTVPFLDLTIHITPPVLIPRPETEQWCFDVITELRQSHHVSRSILDLCTGSGVLALSLAKAFPGSVVEGIDIQEHAVACASQNKILNHLSNVSFFTSDLFEHVDNNAKYDLIVANPPYVSATEWQYVDQTVARWEDPVALVAPEEGYAIIEKIIIQSPDFLHQNAQLWIEIGYQQSAVVEAFFKSRGFQNIRLVYDIQGHVRVVTGVWKQ